MDVGNGGDLETRCRHFFLFYDSCGLGIYFVLRKVKVPNRVVWFLIVLQ